MLVINVGSRSNMLCANVAAGTKAKCERMYIDSFSAASSLLPYESLALQEYPFLGSQIVQEVQVKPLDDILQSCEAEDVDPLIMDAQGYEDEVPRGASRTLKSCKVVMSELSLQTLYVGSSTFDSVYQALVREGFRPRYLINPNEGASHQVLQIDGIFVREL